MYFAVIFAADQARDHSLIIITADYNLKEKAVQSHSLFNLFLILNP